MKKQQINKVVIIMGKLTLRQRTRKAFEVLFKGQAVIEMPVETYVEGVLETLTPLLSNRKEPKRVRKSTRKGTRS